MSCNRARGSLVWVSGIRRNASLLLAGLLVAACQSKDLTDERLVRFVDEVMFGGPYDAHIPKDGRVAKWSGDPLVVVTGVNAGEYRSRVSTELERFSILSGLDARIANTAIPTNLKITFVDSEDFLINRENVPCFAWIQTNSGQIVNVEVQLSTVDPDMIDRCLSHELMHAFGLRYHSGIVRSVLSSAHTEEHLSPWDELAIRVLYDTRLHLGAPRATAVPAIREIVSDRIVRP